MGRVQGQGGGREIQGFFERVAEWKSEGGRRSADKKSSNEYVDGRVLYVKSCKRGRHWNGMECDIRTSHCM